MSDDRYPVNPLDGPARFADELATLKQRISSLEARSGRGMQPVIYDPATGQELVRLGLLSDGSYGLLLHNAAGRTVLRVSNDGTFLPQIPIPMLPNPGASVGNGSTMRPGTTSGTFTELWRGDFWSVGPTIFYDLLAYANAGDIDWEILCYENGGTPTVAVGPTNETSNMQRSGAFTIPTAGLVSGTDPAGRPMTVRVLVRRNSGANAADMGVNAPCLNY